MLVMKYAPGGNLHNYLQENFTKLTWRFNDYGKLDILWQILEGYIGYFLIWFINIL